MDTLSTLLVTAAGISVVIKIAIDLLKALVTISGRTTQLVAVIGAIALALLGDAVYTPSHDWLQSVWIGIQAAAMSIGIDQAMKRTP